MSVRMGVHSCLHAYMCMFVCVCVRAPIGMGVRVCLHAYIFTCVCVSLHGCAWLFACLHVHVCLHGYVWIFVHLHVHMYVGVSAWVCMAASMPTCAHACVQVGACSFTRMC